jgi:hypothetical protein
MSYAVTMSSRVGLGFVDEEKQSTISLNVMYGQNLNMWMREYLVSFEQSRFLTYTHIPQEARLRSQSSLAME